MIGVLSQDEIEAMLARQHVGRLACSANDRPYVVPINYAYDGQFIYACSGPGRKIEVMREQPLVCFEVDEVANPSTWRSIVAEGVYEELTEEGPRVAALARLNGHGSGAVAKSLNAAARIVVFRIRIIGTSGRFERRDA